MPDPIRHPRALMPDPIRHPPALMLDLIQHPLAPLHAIALATCSKNAGEEEIE